MALAGPVAMVAAFGQSAVRSTGSRALALMQLRRLLDDARTLRRFRRAVDARRYRKLSAPLADLQALIPVAEGKLPLMVRVSRAAPHWQVDFANDPA